jgi:predicted O-methyltransferase YrrM
MSKDYIALNDELAAYVREVTLREPPPLERLRLEAENHPHGSMQLGAEQGQFLHMLARVAGARKTLEIGVFLGYSSTWVALALPPGGKIIACDRSEEYTARARQVWREAGVEDRIDLRLGPALDTLDGLIAAGEAGTFDMALIDADKGNYSNYYERALVLVRKGGLIVTDNVLWGGRVVDPEVHDADTEAIRAFNRKLHGDERIALSMATIGDGLTLACKL